MDNDFRVSYMEYHKEKDNFKCYHCEKNFMNKKSFLWYGCSIKELPNTLCRSCCYKERYGSKTIGKAMANNVIEKRNSCK